LRTNFFGNGNEWRNSFSDWIIFKLKSKEEFFGYEDVFYTPISIQYLLEFMHELLKIQYKGIIHVAGSERISKYEFIVKMAEILNLDYYYLKKAKYSDSKQKVNRPLDMSLSIGRLEQLFDREIPDVETSIKSIL
jgi:dTDP-4-dehydrorhamnose reductase